MEGKLNLLSGGAFLRWTLVLFLTCLLASYFVESLSKYRQGRVGITTSEEPATDFPPPAVTVCAIVRHFRPVWEFNTWIYSVTYRDAFSSSSGGSSGGSGGLDGRSNPYAVNPGGLVLWNSSTSPTWLETLHVNRDLETSLCSTYVSPRDLRLQFGSSNNMYFMVFPQQLNPVIPRPFYVIVKVTHPFALINSYYDFLGSSHITIMNSKRFARLLHYGEFVSLDKEDRPCLDDDEFEEVAEAHQTNMLSCMLDYVTERVPCFGEGGRGNYSIPCTRRDLERLNDILAQLNEGGESKFLRMIGCKPPCRLPTYNLEVEGILEDIPTGGGGNGTTPEDKEDFIVAFAVVKPSKTVRKEFLVYDLASFAGDVGGIVGMLLGTSVIALYDGANHLLGWTLRAVLSSRGRKGGSLDV